MFVSDRVSDNVALLVTILLVSNSAANPLVYAFLKRDIKENSRGLSIGPWYHKVQLNVSTIKTATSGTEESAAIIERCSL